MGSSSPHSFGIQFRTTLVLLPLLIATSIAGMTLSYSSSRRSVEEAASNFLAYRSLQLKDYLESQWLLLEELNLTRSDSYRRLVLESAKSYAEGLIRTSEEIIFARDNNGGMVYLAGGPTITEIVSNGEIDPAILENESDRQNGYSGFLRLSLGADLNFVAVTFPFQPLEWQVFVAESERSLYRGSRSLIRHHLWILLATSGIGVSLFLWMAYRILKPIREIADGMARIASDHSFSRRVPVRYDDEVGYLAHQFNRMNESLDNAYQRIRLFATSEAMARQEVTQREYETLEVMGRATDYKDPETGAHIVRVGLYSEMLARLLGADDEQCTIIRHAAPLHDIGKLGIPDAILLKPGKLTDNEYAAMKQHTIIAFEILKDSNSEYLKAGAEIALTHHERYNGSGYPYGLVGEEIPLFGRIVGLVDVFDALTSHRPYKKEWPVDDAFEELKKGRGTLFEPRAVDLFVAERAEITAILEGHREDVY